MPFRAHGPEPCASAYSATRARCLLIEGSLRLQQPPAPEQSRRRDGPGTRRGDKLRRADRTLTTRVDHGAGPLPWMIQRLASSGAQHDVCPHRA